MHGLIPFLKFYLRQGRFFSKSNATQKYVWIKKFSKYVDATLKVCLGFSFFEGQKKRWRENEVVFLLDKWLLIPVGQE